MKQKPRVLIADDEKILADLLAKEISRTGRETHVVYDGEAALQELKERDYDVALLDIKMPVRDGLSTLAELKKMENPAEVIILTGHATLETALTAMKSGAYDYITKPCKLDELDVLLDKAMEKRIALLENRSLRRYLGKGGGSGEPRLIGESPILLSLLAKTEKIAKATDLPVLITGETGTGKELVAREIHRRSPLRDQPFVVLNCALMQESLVESELFGHEKGAFTGATQRKIGLFEVADGGTLLLDEVGELPRDVQAKLLRFIQFGELRRVGGTEAIHLTVRLVAATNRELEKEVEEGRFREDLFYRLNVVQLHLPPVRERPEDIPLLIAYFLEKYRDRKVEPIQVEDQTMDLLRSYRWAGNVREIENFVRRLLVFQETSVVSVADVECAFSPPGKGPSEPQSLLLVDVERAHILKILAICDGNKAKAAETLGIANKTLYNKLNDYKKKGYVS